MQIYGIVNVTPDSFSDGGLFNGPEAAVAHGLRLAAEGADVLDIGGESTRPGADPVPVEQEIQRVIPVIEGLRRELDVPLSVDTRKPEVAEAAMAAGATIWNDVSALGHAPASVETAARLGCTVILMHMQGTPQTMQAAPNYADVTAEVLSFLANRISACVSAGIPRERIIADPGIGFGKTLAHNLALFRNLEGFAALGVPMMIGASRKRFIAGLDRDTPPHERLGGSLAAVLRAQQAGWQAARVHDVAATRQALAVAAAIARPGMAGA